MLARIFRPIAIAGLVLVAFLGAWFYPLALLIAGIVGVMWLVLAWMTAGSGRGPSFGVTRRQFLSFLVWVAVTFGLIAVLTFITQMDDGTSQGALIGLLLVGLGGTFVAARQLPLDWATVSAPVILMACVWVGVASLYVAYRIGWQGLEWEVDEPGDIGDPRIGLALLLFFGTLAAPIPGLVIGFFSQAYKHGKGRGA